MRIHQLTKNETIKIATKQSVNFQNYGKHQAYQKSEKEISQLEKEINALPIVEEFRSAQFEANELLQLMVSTMEQSLNKHNEKHIMTHKQKGIFKDEN